MTKATMGVITKLMFYLTLIPADGVIVRYIQYIIAERNSCVQLKGGEKIFPHYLKGCQNY